jgi:tetratricopeptide (TPR) repeat protein
VKENGLNWQLQLAATLAPGESDLLAGAQRARELAGEGRYGAALEVLWKHLVSATRRREFRPRAFLLLHMGHVYRRWMIEVAFKFFRDARDLSRRSGFRRGEMVADASLGLLYRDWNAPEKALPRFERCLGLAEECAGAWWRRDVLVEIVECLVALGETERATAERRRIDRLDAEILADLWSERGADEPEDVGKTRRAREEADRAGTDR